MQDRNYKGHVVMLAANVIFGLNAPISKTILNEGSVSPWAMTFFRMLGAASLFWIASLFVKRERVPLKDLGLIFLASMTGIVLNQGCFMIGLSYTSPIDSSVIATLVPILTMMFAAVFLKEPITLKKTLGVLIGASGALLLVYASYNGASRSGSSFIGNLLVILSATSYSIYLGAFRKLIMRYSPITLMKWMFLFAAIVCGPVCWNDVASIDYASLDWDIYLRILYVVAFSTFIAYLLIPIGQKLLRPTIVSMYNYVQPLVASVVAVILGLGTFGLVKGSAAALIFLGVYIVTTSKSRSQMDAEKLRR